MGGRIVKTKSGKRGQTNNSDSSVSVQISKDAPFDPSGYATYKTMIKVTCDDGTKLLCDPDSLTLLGYWD